MSLANAGPAVNRNQLTLFEPAQYHDATRWGWFSLLFHLPPEVIHDPQIDLFTGQAGEDLRRGGTKQQRTYLLRELPHRLQGLDPRRDTWIGQGEFCRPNRRLVNLARLGLVWVDLDTYHVDRLAGLSAEQLTGQVLQFCADSGLPAPSLVVFSGRGLQVKWILERPVPAKALPRWQAVQAALIAAFAEYGADPKASDASRVLRLVNTVNTRSGQVVRVTWPADPDHVPTYDFEQLAREFLPMDRRELEESRRERTAAKAAQVERPASRGVAGYGLRRLWWYRLLDIRRLVELRQWSSPPTGWQDLFLWLSTCALAWSVRPERLRLEVDQLAREFAPTWRIEEARAVVSTTLRRAEAAARGERVEWQGGDWDPRYRFTNARLVDLLRITPDEERQLLTIVSTDEARRRDQVRKEKEHRAAGMVSRAEYLASVEQQRVEARLRAARGESQKAIAEALGVDRTTVYRWLRQG